MSDHHELIAYGMQATQTVVHTTMAVLGSAADSTNDSNSPDQSARRSSQNTY